MPEARLYRPDERPDVEVLVDGTWWPGELHAWWPHEDGSWEATCSWRTGPAQQFRGRVPYPARVRPADDLDPGGLSPSGSTDEQDRSGQQQGEHD